MNKLIVALLAFAGFAIAVSGCTPAESQSRVDTLTWTLATQYTDGTPLAAADIESTLIQWGAKGGPYNVGSVTVLAPATSVSVPNLQDYGTVCYVAFTKLKSGVISNASAEVCKTVQAPPKAPSGLKVQ